MRVARMAGASAERGAGAASSAQSSSFASLGGLGSQRRVLSAQRRVLVVDPFGVSIEDVVPEAVGRRGSSVISLPTIYQSRTAPPVFDESRLKVKKERHRKNVTWSP